MLNSKPASEQSEGEAAWRVIKRVAPFIWPSNSFNLRARVALALLALVAAKVIAILGPILDRHLISFFLLVELYFTINLKQVLQRPFSLPTHQRTGDPLRISNSICMKSHLLQTK